MSRIDIESEQWMQRAQGSLEDLARATGFPFSVEPKDAAISLFRDLNNNVYAMLVTGFDAHGKVERGVTPFGDPPMTAREFVSAAAIAEAAVYAIHQYRSGGRLDPDTQAQASKELVAVDSEQNPRNRAQRLLDALTAEIGAPAMQISENKLGLFAINEPSALGRISMPAGQLAEALHFAINAVHHHENYQRRIEQERSVSNDLEINR